MADKVIAIQKDFNNYEKLHQDLPYLHAEVIYHVREELACTVEDVLLRRTRAMFLDAKAALECAPIVAKLMARELNKSDDWIKCQLLEIQVIAKKFMYNF
jgi:glycerol-3-phosphate dehydrogenase